MQFRISNTRESSTFTYTCATANAVSGLGDDSGFTSNHFGRAICHAYMDKHECHVREHLAFHSSGRYFNPAVERPGSGDADADYCVHDHCHREQRKRDGQHNRNGEPGYSNDPVHGTAHGGIGGQQFGFDVVYLERDLSFN